MPIWNALTAIAAPRAAPPAHILIIEAEAINPAPPARILIIEAEAINPTPEAPAAEAGVAAAEVAAAEEDKFGSHQYFAPCGRDK